MNYWWMLIQDVQWIQHCESFMRLTIQDDKLVFLFVLWHIRNQQTVVLASCFKCWIRYICNVNIDLSCLLHWRNETDALHCNKTSSVMQQRQSHSLCLCEQIYTDLKQLAWLTSTDVLASMYLMKLLNWWYHQ